jgi:hypothetical protein
MKRILLSTLMTLGFVMALTPAANAETLKIPCGGGGTYTLELPSGEVLLTNVRNCSGALVLDSRVKIIGANAFDGRPITSVVFPKGLKEIGQYAFRGTKLTKIAIPNSVTRIGISAFRQTLLTSVVIPKSVKIIGSGAFSENKYLTTATFPDDYPEKNGGFLPVALFEGNYSLTTVYYCGRVDFPDLIVPLNFGIDLKTGIDPTCRSKKKK